MRSGGSKNFQTEKISEENSLNQNNDPHLEPIHIPEKNTFDLFNE
jgi:hypothetical protein